MIVTFFFYKFVNRLATAEAIKQNLLFNAEKGKKIKTVRQRIFKSTNLSIYSAYSGFTRLVGIKGQAHYGCTDSHMKMHGIKESYTILMNFSKVFTTKREMCFVTKRCFQAILQQ